MGSAIIRGLLNRSVCDASGIMVSDSSPAVTNGLQKDFPGIRVAENLDNFSDAALVILAVKPQVYRTVSKNLGGKISADCVVVTIAPGIRIEAVSSWLGGHKKIIRTMPNTPALIGEGLTALCASRDINKKGIPDGTGNV